MKNLITTLVLIVASFSVFAQQDPQFSMNMFNLGFINPAYVGHSGYICGTILNRQQWMGFEGAPRTRLFSGNMPLDFPDKGKSGIGMNICSDGLGFENNFLFNGAYSYKFDLGPGRLGLGMSIGLLNKSLKGEWVPPDFLISDGQTGIFDDPAIPQDNSFMALDIGIGAFYGAEDYYIGISTSHINKAEIKYSGMDTIPFIARHYYIIARYFIDLPNRLFELQPSAFIKTDGPTAQVDINAMLLYNKMFFGGLSYRFEESIVAIAGTILPMNLKIGLAYDVNIGKMSSYCSGTFEIMLNYCFTIEKTPDSTIYHSVRY